MQCAAAQALGRRRGADSPPGPRGQAALKPSPPFARRPPRRLAGHLCPGALCGLAGCFGLERGQPTELPGPGVAVYAAGDIADCGELPGAGKRCSAHRRPGCRAAGRIRGLLWPHLGTVLGPHPAGARQPRTPDAWRSGLLRLFRGPCGERGRGYLQPARRQLAADRAEQRPVRRGPPGATGLAEGGAVDAPGALHARLLAPPPVQLGTAR